MDDTTTTSPRLDLEAINQRRQAASDLVHALCQPRGTAGAREWMMSIPARPDVDPDMIIDASLRDNSAMARAIDRLTAERDWYRAGLHHIANGHAANNHPADIHSVEYAISILKWAGSDTPNPVDRLRETVAALVTAATYAVECWGAPEQDWCRSDMETAMKQARAALELAAASHADNDAAVDGGQIAEATK